MTSTESAYLRRLALVRYGNLEDVEFVLGEGLTVVAGPNEAGKSTALAALGDLLWGIPSKSDRTYRFPRGRLRIDADIRTAQGDDLAVVRTSKGLQDPEGAPTNHPWEGDGSLGRDLWLQGFGLDHAQLRRGGQDLFRNGGDLAELVFRAREGADAAALLEAIEAEADKLYKEHGNAKNVAVRKAWRAYEEKRDAARLAVTRASEVTEAAERRAALENDDKDLVADQQAAQRRLDETELRLRCLEPAQALRRLQLEIEALQAAGPALGDADLERYAQAAPQREEAEKELAGIDERLAAARAKRVEHPVDRTVLDRDVEIDRANGALQARLGDRDRAADKERRAADLERQAHHVLAGLAGTAGTGTGQSASAPEALAARETPAELAADLDAAADGVRTAETQRDQRRAALREAEEDLAGYETVSTTLDADGVAALRQLVTTVQKPASPAHRLRDYRERQAEAAAELRDALVAAGAEDPEAPAPVPPDRTRTTELAQDVEHAETGLARTREEHDAAISDLELARAELAALTDDEAIESADLPTVRSERDQRWAQVRGAWLHGSPIATDPEILADDYEDAVGRADRLADALREDAERVARVSDLSTRIERGERAVAETAARQEEAARHLEARRSAWRAFWQELAVRVPAREDWHVVRQHLESASKAATVRETSAALCKDLEHEVAQVARQLSDQLARLGAPRTGLDLDTLLLAAQDVITEAESQAQTLGARRSAERKVVREATRLSDAESALAEAQQRLATLVQAAGLPETVGPDGWRQRREVLAAARNLVGEQTELLRDARALRQAWDDFAAGVATLAAATGEAGDPETCLPRLHGRLVEARRNSELDSELREQIAAYEQRAAAAKRKRQAARSVLAELAAGLGVDAAPEDDAAVRDALNAPVARGQKLLDLRGQEATKRAELGNLLPADRGVEETVAALADVDNATLRLAEQQEQAALEEATEATLEANRQLGAARTIERDLLAAAPAAELHAVSRERLAEVAELAERYATLAVQRCVLRNVLEAYVQDHATPLLTQAGEILDRLTHGAWVGFVIEEDSGTRTLRVVRGGTTDVADVENLAPHQLSEGTRDQVFLALRLAGIVQRQRERAERGEAPVPVVLDDVVMAFDDRRAHAALEVMSELAEDMQIIVFTHHAHVADLAEGLKGEQDSVVRLPGTLPSTVAALPGPREAGEDRLAERSAG